MLRCGGLRGFFFLPSFTNPSAHPVDFFFLSSNDLAVSILYNEKEKIQSGSGLELIDSFFCHTRREPVPVSEHLVHSRPMQCITNQHERSTTLQKIERERKRESFWIRSSLIQLPTASTDFAPGNSGGFQATSGCTYMTNVGPAGPAEEYRILLCPAHMHDRSDTRC